MFNQKYKLIFLFFFLFIFLLNIFIFASPVFGYECRCTPLSESFTTQDKQECDKQCESLLSPPSPEKAKAASTCVLTDECRERWQKAKQGILRDISVECYCCGDCGLNDFVNLFVDAANYLFGIVGALALLFFIYGGVLWLTAGGKAEQIERGKKVLIGAVIGLVIVFGAWLIVQFVMTALGVKPEFLKEFKATK